MENQIIGFANTMYTLWISSVEDRYFGDDWYKVTKYTYVKNISKDIDTVKALYPNVEIDLTLKGHGTFERVIQKEQLENDVFWYGRYKGIIIDECADDSYIRWYWESKICDDNREYAKRVLEDRNYHFIDNRCLSHNEYEHFISHESRKKELIQNFIENGFIDITVTENPNYYGELGIENNLIVIKFESVKQMYYSGYEYYLPIVNGKTKRLKNKRVRIYGNLEDDMINVSNIEIL